MLDGGCLPLDFENPIKAAQCELLPDAPGLGQATEAAEMTEALKGGLHTQEAMAPSGQT